MIMTPFRAYDAQVARWLSRDPIAEDGGINMYGYVGNSPLGGRDALGLTPEDVLAGMGSWLKDNYNSFRHAGRTLGLLGEEEERQAATENALINGIRERALADPCFRDELLKQIAKKLGRSLRDEAVHYVGRILMGGSVGKGVSSMSPKTPKLNGALGVALFFNGVNGGARGSLEGMFDDLRSSGLTESDLSGFGVNAEQAAVALSHMISAGIIGR